MHSSRMRTARSSSRLLGVSASVHAGIHLFPPGLGLNTPWVWAWRPPPARPINFQPGCGPGETPSQTPQPPSLVWAWKPPPPQLPPWVWACRLPLPARPLNLHPGCGPAEPPTCGQTDMCKNITFANFVCGR